MTFDQLEHNLGLAQFYVDIEKLITTWPLEELEIHGAKGFHIMAPELKNLTLLCDDWSNGHFLEVSKLPLKSFIYYTLATTLTLFSFAYFSEPFLRCVCMPRIS